MCKGYLLFIRGKNRKIEEEKIRKGNYRGGGEKETEGTKKKRDDDSRSERLTVYSSVCFSVRVHDLY